MIDPPPINIYFGRQNLPINSLICETQFANRRTRTRPYIFRGLPAVSREP
jgi:hypothetical protein